MDVAPIQLVSVSTALIPFLEHDDANRALMGSNMQRQAVPLLRPDPPLIGTGMEERVARDSGQVVLSDVDGVVTHVSGERIVVTDPDGQNRTFKMMNFVRSNQGTCVNQRPIVSRGDVVKVGDVLADSLSTAQGELALGQNLLVAFMSWEGYNFEDAIILNKRLVKEDRFTSIHIEKHEVESRDTKLGPEGDNPRHSKCGRREPARPRRRGNNPCGGRDRPGRHTGRQDNAQGRDRTERGGEAASRDIPARRRATSRTLRSAFLTDRAAK